MSKECIIDISEMESKLAAYKSFFRSTKEVNEQVLSIASLSEAQSQFLEKLQEFDFFTRSNRNPNSSPEVTRRAETFINDLDQIEKEIRLEQEKSLTFSSSQMMSNLFIDEDSILAPNASRIEKLLSNSNAVIGSTDFAAQDQEEEYSMLDSQKSAEELHLYAQQVRNEQRESGINSNASLLFSILKSLQSRPDCPKFLTKSLDEKSYRGEFFEIKISDNLTKPTQERSVRVVRPKDGGFAILSKSQNSDYIQISDSNFSDKLLNKILRAIYGSMPVKSVVLDVDLLKVANNFYIDKAGKVISYNNNLNSLCTISPGEVTIDDLKIIEDFDCDLSHLYKILIDIGYSQSAKAVQMSDGRSLICVSSKNIPGSYAVENMGGIIRVYKKSQGSDYILASNSSQVVSFQSQMLEEVKYALIFNAFSAALKGNWDLLVKVSKDDRISCQSIIGHVEHYISSDLKHPFDINFISKIAVHVPALSLNIAKLVVKNRSEFLSQIIYGFADKKLYSSSFIIRILSRSQNILDPDVQNKKEHMSSHYIKETFGYITNLLVNSRNIDFENQHFFNQDDFYSSYTNCLSRFSNLLLSADSAEISKMQSVIHRSFAKIIDASRNLPPSNQSNSYLFLNLVTKALSSFSHKPGLSLMIHGSMIDALSDSKLARDSLEFKAIILKICSSLVKNSQYSSDVEKVFNRLAIACHDNPNLMNLVRISLNQVSSRDKPQSVRLANYQKFSNQTRLQAISEIAVFKDHTPHCLDLNSTMVEKGNPQLLLYDEVNAFTSSTRQELAEPSIDLAPSVNRPKILKLLREIEGEYIFSKPDIINLEQTFVDHDRCFTKAIICDNQGNILYKVGDSIHDFICAPINYYFADNIALRDYLLDQVKELDVAAQSHGYNPLSIEDRETSARLKPRLVEAVKKVANHVLEQDSNHPYLTFLRGFNQSSEGEMLLDTQTFLEARYSGKYMANSQKDTITVMLAPNSVTYQSNCLIEISKQGFVQGGAPLATMQANGSITIDYVRNSKLTNNSFVHSFVNHKLDVKTTDELQNFVATSANCNQFDQIFEDLLTDPSSANALSSLIQDPNSTFRRIISSSSEEQIMISRDQESGFVFSVTRNPDRTINSVILHDGIYGYDKSAKDFDQISPSLQPSHHKELAARLSKISQLGDSINKVSRPIRDAFLELKDTKFSKKSQIGEVKKISRYRFQFRKIGKLNSGKSLYLDESGRLLINKSLTSTDLVPINYPQPHAIDKIPADQVSSDFDLTFKAQHFDYRRKSFRRYPESFSVKVRKIGTFKDLKGSEIDIYQDRQGRRFKSAKDSSRIQEILDLSNQTQSGQVHALISSFKERAQIHEIFNLDQPKALIEESQEVTIGKIQYLKSGEKEKQKTPVREICLKANTKSGQKAFHIDRFGEIYTKNENGKMQSHDLLDLDPQSRKSALKALDLSYDNIYLTNLYSLLEKNNSSQKQAINLKPYKSNSAHIFVKNGAKYALFKDFDTQDHHLMRLTYPKSVKESKTGIITDPDQVKLITSQIHVKAIYDDLAPGTYLVNGARNLKISQIMDRDVTIKSFLLSDVDQDVEKGSEKDLELAIDSNYRLLYKKPEEKFFHLTNFRQAKKLIPYFEKCAKTTLVKLDNWKTHYNSVMLQREKSLTSKIKIFKNSQIDNKDLNLATKKEISAPNKVPSPHISNITVDQLHTHIPQDDHLI